MVYNSKKGVLFPIITGAFAIAMLGFFIFGPWQVAMMFLVIDMVFLWMLLDTYYIIRDGELYYKNAFIKGSVSISTMYEIIRHNKGLHSCSIKPALSIKGLIIKYNRWDDMFVSPENQDEFIAELRAVNPDIKVS